MHSLISSAEVLHVAYLNLRASFQSLAVYIKRFGPLRAICELGSGSSQGFRLTTLRIAPEMLDAFRYNFRMIQAKIGILPVLWLAALAVWPT